MAYQIDRYNNTVLTVVEDGTIDQTTDLKLVGKNYAGYGEIQNENFIYLLENFAGANQPPRALSGQVWFDSASSKLKFYDGTKWRTTGGSEVSSTEPTGLTEGDFWWDNANKQLYVYDGTDFILIGPQNAGAGVTQMVSLEVLDTSNITRSIIAATINDEIMFVISSIEFTLNALTPLTGFDRIKKGITLINTRLATNGVTSTDHWFWGTASNAAKLGGIDASGYITSANPVFTTVVAFPDAGITIGNDLDLKIYIENGNQGVIENQNSTNGIIKFKATNGSGASTHSLTVTSSGMNPAADNTINLGTSSLGFNTVYAYSLVGEATKATSLRVGSDYRTASVSSTNNTVVVRDATGNIAANLFQGTATSARYADLAEKYSTAIDLPVGTAVAVCSHADHEVEPAVASNLCIGVVSDKPAYLMNSEADGQAIALKGRVPVRVTGPVKKGQAVFAWDAGVCSTIQTTALVGIALETNSDEGEKLVECVLKV